VSVCIGRQTCQHLSGHYFSPRRQETMTSNSLPWSLSQDNWVPLVQVLFDSRVNSDTSRIRTPLKAVRRALPRPPRQSNSYQSSNLFVCYAPQSSINFGKKKKWGFYKYLWHKWKVTECPFLVFLYTQTYHSKALTSIARKSEMGVSCSTMKECER